MDEQANKTVVVFDLVAFGAIARRVVGPSQRDLRRLNELYEQIQTFLNKGLAAIGARREERLLDETGDGGIFVFDLPAQAHQFAEAIHAQTTLHNRSAQDPYAKRFFRSGASTGPMIARLNSRGPSEVIGMPLTDATRLQTKAKPGSLLVDQATFDDLPPVQQVRYASPKQVKGKRNEKYEG